VDFIDFKHESHMLSSMKFMDLTWICLISPDFAMKRHGSHIQEVDLSTKTTDFSIETKGI
jgi:hypothetical protein